MTLTVQSFTPDDPLAVALVVIGGLIIAAALVIANHNLKDRF